ncbi:response regulator transcription factor [Niveispirillum sp. BGYR6]|uniref:response regulator transcription factor n=1 Tax=Niveispirillum sp. BGYR6 TaxID=2971249 RepID=UPI0022B99202|nr:response regulator transcription factor [Niveispirillum sp. BGYR6]MDG5494000.1 response regulator transcription factor [Niveispirillum sp. BGYR6]
MTATSPADQPLIHVVEDDRSVRDSLEDLLASVGLPARLFASAAEFLRAEPVEAPGCLVLDVRMPGMSGLELQAEMARRGLRLPIIFITGHGDIPMSVQAMKAGAVEFLTKPFREQDLLDAIQKAIALDRTQRQADAVADELRRRHATLNEGERDVLALVVTGLLNKQIAARLEVSEITVKVRRAQVMKKMQAATLADLIRFSDMLKPRL